MIIASTKVETLRLNTWNGVFYRLDEHQQYKQLDFYYIDIETYKYIKNDPTSLDVLNRYRISAHTRKSLGGQLGLDLSEFWHGRDKQINF